MNLPGSRRRIRRGQFKEVFERGSFLVGRLLIFHFLSASSPSFSFGVLVSKKYGKAHERNRFKRRMRAIVRELKKAPSSISIVVRPRLLAKSANYQALKEELQGLFARSKVGEK